MSKSLLMKSLLAFSLLPVTVEYLFICLTIHSDVYVNIADVGNDLFNFEKNTFLKCHAGIVYLTLLFCQILRRHLAKNGAFA